MIVEQRSHMPPVEQSTRRLNADGSWELWTKVLLLVALLVLPGSLTVSSAGEVNYRYDKSGRLREATYPDTSRRKYVLDPAGNRLQVETTLGGGALQFNAPTASIGEGSGQIRLSVTRALSTKTAISVSYATRDGSALAGRDYTSTSGTLQWAVGDAAPKEIVVPILDNQFFQATRTFTVALSNATGGAVLGGVSESTVGIADNDPLFFSITSTSVTEGVTAQLSVTKSGGVTLEPYNVNFTIADGTARRGIDVDEGDYQTPAPTGTLTLPANQTSQAFFVATVNDRVPNGSRFFTVTLSSPSGGAALGTSVGTVTILDNDPPPVFTFPYTTAQYPEFTFPELLGPGDSPGILLDIAASGGLVYVQPSFTLSTTNGTATLGSDFGTPVNYNSPTGALQVFVPILDDNLSEGSETFTLTITGVNNINGLIGQPNSVTITIVDNEPPPPPPVVSLGSVGSLSENVGIVNIPVIRTVNSRGAVSAQCVASDGSARRDIDYRMTVSTVSWADGDGSPKNCQVQIIDNSVSDSVRTFSVALANASGANIGGAPISLVILDNEPAPPSLAAPVWDSYWGQCLTDFGCGTFVDTAVTWLPVAGATQYEFEITYLPPLSGQTRATVTGTQYVPALFSAVSARVRACNGSTCGPYSTTIYLYAIPF